MGALELDVLRQLFAVESADAPVGQLQGIAQSEGGALPGRFNSRWIYPQSVELNPVKTLGVVLESRIAALFDGAEDCIHGGLRFGDATGVGSRFDLPQTVNGRDRVVEQLHHGVCRGNLRR